MAKEAGSGSSPPKAKTWCDHLALLSSDLTRIPKSDTPCKSPFVNKHMVQHYQQTKRSHALSYRCSVIPQLRGVYETAYIPKFGEAPSFRTV